MEFCWQTQKLAILYATELDEDSIEQNNSCSLDKKVLDYEDGSGLQCDRQSRNQICLSVSGGILSFFSCYFVSLDNIIFTFINHFEDFFSFYFLFFLLL